MKKYLMTMMMSVTRTILSTTITQGKVVLSRAFLFRCPSGDEELQQSRYDRDGRLPSRFGVGVGVEQHSFALKDFVQVRLVVRDPLLCKRDAREQELLQKSVSEDPYITIGPQVSC
jgi:hypothetical protein